MISPEREITRLRSCITAFFSRKHSRRRASVAKGTLKGGGDIACQDECVERENDVTGDASLYGEELDFVMVAGANKICARGPPTEYGSEKVSGDDESRPLSAVSVSSLSLHVALRLPDATYVVVRVYPCRYRGGGGP